MDPLKTKVTPVWEKITVEWVLCSLQVDDLVLIAPEGLNDLPITSQYHKISKKHVKKEYFNYNCYICKEQGLKRKHTAPPS